MKPTEAKTPPSAQDIEESILGAILIERSAFEKIAEILKPEMFYNENYGRVFTAMQQLYNIQQQIDMHTVTEAMTKNGTLEKVGGMYFIAQLTTKIGSAANIEFHAMIVKQKWISREIIKLSAEAEMKAYEDTEDISDIISELEKGLTQITEQSDDEDMDFTDVISETKSYMIEMQRRRQAGEDIALHTPLNDENDKLSGGFRSPELIILAARPAMGKTQIAIEHTEKFLNYGGGAFFSLEMKKTQILLRMVAKSGISMDNIKQGQMNREEWEIADRRLNELEKYDLSIYDKVRTINGIVRKCRKLKRQKRLNFVVIDYLQLIQTNEKFGTRDLEVGSITNKLKTLAIELDVPIMLLCQLNRDLEKRGDKRPMLSDLRESGNIEQDADIVMFINRPSYYDENAQDNENVSWRNRGEIIIAKSREGQTGAVVFEHDDQFKRIWDYEPANYMQRTFAMNDQTIIKNIQTNAWEIKTPMPF